VSELVVAATGTANLASVLAGLSRVGGRPKLVEQPEDVRSARALVLPGVGTYRAAMGRLQEDGLVEAIREHVRAGRPTLAVCLGFQLLFEASDESPGVEGLGLWSERVRTLPETQRRPHLGWNDVVPAAGCRWLTPGEAYFAHSFWVTPTDAVPQFAETDYGQSFVAAVEDRGILATQFHPELSGRWGTELMGRWLAEATC